MEKKKGKWVKNIENDNNDEVQIPKSKDFNAINFRLQLEEINQIYIGSLICWGVCNYQFHTKNLQEQLKQISLINSDTLRLASMRDQTQIEVHVPFSHFFSYITKKTRLGQFKYYCCVPKPTDKCQQQKQADQCYKRQKQLYKEWENSKKKKDKKMIMQKIRDNQFKMHKTKNKARKVIPIRLQVFISKQIFNERSMEYVNNLKKLDNMQTLLNTLKASSDQYRELKISIERLIQDQLFYQKISRSLLLYLMEKTNIRIINRSFIKPPPKLNFLMRQYRRLTIGLITKNKRAQRRIRMKIQNWKRIFQYYSLMYPCIGPFNQQAFTKKYYKALPKEHVIWQKHSSGFGRQMLNNQIYKIQIKLGIIQNTSQQARFLVSNRKKIMEQIGAHGFEQNQEDSESDDQEMNEASKKSMDLDQFKLMKKNQSLMEKFETQNKYFKVHKTPTSMISQLKPYQGQALQWMKYREGKITVQQLFQAKYRQEVTDFEFQRKLSPFWEQIQSITGQKFFVNYLTGEFTKTFHDWKSIKGGILADQMGLGKTVMTLSLLADQNWEGVNLIVVPVAVLLQWKQEVQKHCGTTILVYQFHSDAKNRRKKNLRDYQIVLITYATLGHQYRSYQTKQPGKDQKYIFDYEFQRVVLDEAHNIRGTNTQMFNAVMNLKSKYSWCLTGTLVQNSQQDLFAIFKFLRVEVFCEQAWWNQYIKNAGCTQAKMNVIQTVLRPIVLRRTKASTSNQGQAIINLTKKKQYIIRPEFSKVEANIYQKLQIGVKKFFRSNIEAGRNYTHVFQIISKLRQFCCHPALIFGSGVEQVQDKDIQQVLNKFLEGGRVAGTSFKQTAVSAMLKNDENCIICLTEVSQQDAVLTQCGHFFCQPCLKRTMQINPICPVCRSPLSAMSYIKKSDFVITEDIKGLTQSSKVTAILNTLEEICQRKQKCVIFTQWIKIIQILSQKLMFRDIQFETITGGMTVEKRQRAIKRFKQRPQIHFLIVSIRAGATGLNLAFANNVMICDPWWNPSHQQQAIGRVHRIGQTQDVNVYRFIMKNSIQQKIQKMHITKRILASQVMMQKGSLSNNNSSSTEELIRLLQN